MNAEPFFQGIKIQVSTGNINHKIVNRRVIRDGKLIPASFNHQFHQQPGGSFVSINETVIANNRMQQGCGLLADAAVESRIGPRKDGLDEMQAGDTVPALKL